VSVLADCSIHRLSEPGLRGIIFYGEKAMWFTASLSWLATCCNLYRERKNFFVNVFF